MGSLSGFGEDWEIPVSKSKALKLLESQGIPQEKLPRMGWQVVLSDYADPRWPEYRHQLQLQNVCGCYVLACSSMPSADWAVFEVAGIGDKVAAA